MSWWDQDVISVLVRCSNGCFSGSAYVYLSHTDASEVADAIRGFPRSRTDSREFEIGTFNPSYAAGGLRVRRYCSDIAGHAVAEIKLRGDGCEAMGEMESVEFRMAIEAAGIDSFVTQLEALQSVDGASASLRMA